MEIDFDVDLHRDRLAIFIAGSKRQVFTASIAFSSRPNPKVRATRISRGLPSGPTTSHRYARPLIFCFPGFLGIFRVGCINLFGSRNAAANVERSTTGAAAVTRAVSGTFARTYATAAAGANAAARAGSIRGHRRQMRKRIAQVGHVRLLQVNVGRNHDGRGDCAVSVPGCAPRPWAE